MIKQTIIFFDGVCGLCNRTVDFVLREDREQNFLFSPLQGETFQRISRDYPKQMQVDSIFVLRNIPGEGKELLQRSDAVLSILDELPRFRWMARVGHVCPAPIRNLLYRLIAATRYPIWGRRESCRLPTSEEKTRFLP
jgi:predicted DCC family thiol-disulfide oxidoreductase YuxK